jgi:hypothetical protein
MIWRYLIRMTAAENRRKFRFGKMKMKVGKIDGI